MRMNNKKPKNLGFNLHVDAIDPSQVRGTLQTARVRARARDVFFHSLCE